MTYRNKYISIRELTDKTHVITIGYSGYEYKTLSIWVKNIVKRMKFIVKRKLNKL